VIAVGEGATASRAGETPAYERPVPGTVQLMTEEPLVVGDERSALRERVANVVHRQPWLIPVVLMAFGAIFLLLRRRR
jgi:hypothetical protein